MVKTKIRFYSLTNRSEFVEVLLPHLYDIKRMKYKELHSGVCNLQVIMYFDMPLDECKELIYNTLRKVIGHYSNPFEIIYIKEVKS